MSEEILELGRKLNEDIENGALGLNDLNSDETHAVFQYLQSEVMKHEDEDERIEPFQSSQENEGTNVD